MHWYQYLSYFFGGAFLANTLPHLGNGVTGRPFQSPFAKPPGEGLSSSTINVLWGFFNLAVAYVLVLLARPKMRISPVIRKLFADSDRVKSRVTRAAFIHLS